MKVPLASVNWRRSRRCESGTCVEVALVGSHVLIRDSKDPDGPRLVLSTRGFTSFLAEIKQDAYRAG